MWAIIIILMLAATVGGFIYLAARLRRFAWFSEKLKSKRRAFWAAFLILLALLALLSLLLGIMNAMVIYLHAVLIWLVCDGVGFCLRRLTHKTFRHYIAGYIAIGLTVAVLATGCFCAFHVFRREYTVSTDNRIIAPLKIAGISDSHIGTTFGYQGFQKHIARIQEEHPDAVVIIGDFVDDSTDREDMENACRVLGTLETTYGVYYVFGNHDAGYRANERRGFDKADLTECLEKNGVTVLEDEVVPLNGDVALIGRADKSRRDRASIEALMAQSDRPYTVVLDHQPNDYDAEAEAGASLVLSGHTHGGQLVPINYVGKWIGADDEIYGHHTRKNTDFIITSGISNWEFYFKTGCVSEYIIVQLIP